MGVRIWLCLGLLATAGVACSTGPDVTDVRVFNPWPAIEEGEIAVETGEAMDCLSAGISVQGLRCATDGGTLMDPCIRDPLVGDRVACFESPWDDTAYVPESVTFSMPDGAASGSGGLPWAIQLVDGDQCMFMGGATGAVGDMRLNYTCDGGDVYGDPDRSGDLWRVFFQEDGGTDMTQRAVAIAWH